jgi:hypothetical protein
MNEFVAEFGGDTLQDTHRFARDFHADPVTRQDEYL